MDSINEQILTLKGEGKSLREIGRELGFSHVGIKARLDRLANPNIIIIEANLYGFEYKHPMEKASINDVVSKLNSVLEELGLEDADKKIIIDAGCGWKFEKVS